MAATEPLRAVVDIGSNSVRLVVFAGPARIPRVLLNEKVAANLGRTLAEDGLLPRKAMDVALRGLARFARIIELMRIADVRVVATAAARDASNGAEFLDAVRALGLEPELLSGEQEATASAGGVLSAFPDADGIVGDLGGGSLELVEVAGGEPGRGRSFPWGTLRLARLRASGNADFERRVARLLDQDGWTGAAAGRRFYLVGGSWRALTILAMNDVAHPLHDPHGYAFGVEEARRLARLIADATPKRLREVPRLSGSRVATLPDAAALLAVVARRLDARELVTSTFGLREGLLYERLDLATRRLDPLVLAAADQCVLDGGDPAEGERLADWIAPVFATEPPGFARLRRAACLLAAIVRRPERDLRARRATDLALHERWVAINAQGRAMLAAALLTHAGERTLPPDLEVLAGKEALAAATRWGTAMRLGVKLAGPVAAALERSTLTEEEGRLTLRLPDDLLPLYGEAVENQHAALADTLGLAAAMEPLGRPGWLARVVQTGRG